MKKVVLVAALATLFRPLFGAESVADLIEAYKRGDHKYVCFHGSKLSGKFRNNEDLVMMYAFSCLNIDYIDRLSVPILALGKTPESRRNRAYFSLIQAQKYILIHALLDNEHYEDLNLPTTDYILSRVFNLFFKNRYKKEGDVYLMEDEKGKYKLYVKELHGKKWVYIEETTKDGKTHIHKYR
ncbi:MAG: hypothetical protein GXO16_08815 [Epsilonproteobacteria bacterium]|nr:hypothetical protein [Campylobacterota bacterium]